MRQILLVEINPGLFIVGTPPAAFVGNAYTYQFVGYGGYEPYNWTLNGSLPDGLVWDANTATISGTPTTPDVETIHIRLKDAQRTIVGQDYLLRVIALPLVIIGDAPDGQQDVVYNYVYTAADGVAPRTFSITGGSLPPGLSLASDGTLSGTPTLQGAYSWTVTVTDDVGTIASLEDSASIAYPVFALTGSLDAAEVGIAYDSALGFTGGDGTAGTWSVSVGSLPAWAALNATTGHITGVPNAAATTNFTLRAVSGDGQIATKAVSITVSAAIALSGTLDDGELGASYLSNLTRSGGVASYTYSISVGSLPSGLSINASTGVISGTPSGSSGDYGFTVRVEDSLGGVATSSQTINIATQVTIAGTYPPGTNGVAYSSSAVAASDGVAPYSYAVTSGSLPTGLSLSSSGVLSGTPTVDDTYNFDVTVTDDRGGTATSSQSITVAAAGYSAEVIADAPELYWRLGDTSGTTAEDETSNNRDGNYNGGYTLNVTGAISDGNKAVTLNGSTGYVSIGTLSALNPSGNFSAEIWIKFTTSQTAKYIMNKWNGSSDGWLVSTDSSVGRRIRFIARIGGSNYTINTGSDINDGNWHHIVCVRNGTSLKIYVDNVEAASGSCSASSMGSNSNSMQVGKNATGASDYFNGSVDEYAFYTSALSAGRIDAHWNAS